ncbi:hypothetical protein GH714_001162 [Hevea brasiliensis]|uniref:Uncharacterized protein n=1 Tax=Hevea brasiliensis TaxID=3981 RepID=A0A6A6KF24_HEVBR|nr:hypothetical protein GH714_001162 [Hevea brasiliensis]
MGRVLDADDGGYFDRMVAAIKLVDESILTAFMQQVRAKVIIKLDDRLAAYVPKKSRGYGQRLDKKPHSHSSLFLHVKSSGSMNEEREKEDEKRKLKEPKEKMPVTLMEPCGSESKMWLRQWNLKSSSTYVLTSSWKKVNNNFSLNLPTSSSELQFFNFT